MNKQIFQYVALIGYTLGLLAYSLPVQAASLTNRSLTLSTSLPDTQATWTFQFSTGSATNLQSIRFQVCTTQSGACTVPGTWTNSTATLVSTSNLGSGWTIDLGTAGSIGITNGAGQSPSGTSSVQFGTVTNPDTAGTFYVRISTFSDSGYADAVDSGVVASATAGAITVTGDKSGELAFCVGTSIDGADCGSLTNGTVGLGQFIHGSAKTTKTATSVMLAAITTSEDYAITYTGQTLTAGSNTLTALANGDISTPGTRQFGFNLRDNSVPDVGADVYGPGSAGVHADYNTVNKYKFKTGDTLATGNGPDASRVFTVAYIANFPSDQPVGNYETTITYLCTPIP